MQDDNRTYRNYAFIAYSALDSKAVKKICRKIETYRLPNGIREMAKTAAGKETPKYIHPLFLDGPEFALMNSPGTPSSMLLKMLEDSKYLIVICSPNCAKSEWANQAIEDFILMGRYERIILYIFDGVPNSGDPATECFPPILRKKREFIDYSYLSSEENEKRHAELNALLDGVDELRGVSLAGNGEKTSRLLIISRMLEINPNMVTCYRIGFTHQRRLRIFRLSIFALSLIILIIILGLWIWNR